MKLGEALARRADLERRIKELKERIAQNLVAQEDEAPQLDPNQLTRDAEDAARDLLDLIQRINRTNAVTAFDESRTLSDALAERDYCKSMRSIHLAGIGEQAQWGMRMMRSELRLVPTIDAKESQRRADEAGRRFRELDARIQEINWTTELN